jgi:hypothetical protein
MSDLMSSAGTRRASELDRLLAPASLAGMTGGAVAGLVAMTGTWIAGSGFFTPLYGVMHTLSPLTVANSVTQAKHGEAFYALRDPMIAGGAVMLTVGGVLGMIFLAVARLVPPRWPVTLTAGVLFSLVVLTLLSATGLSQQSRLVAGSPPVADLTAVAGWAVLLAEYLSFGLVLGAWAAWRPQDLRPHGALELGGLRAPSDQAGPANGDEGRSG